MMTKKVDMIVDLQYGSTGKGLIAGYLATKRKYDVVVNANMPNAGHTFIDIHGNVMIHKVLPNGIVSPNCKTVLIGPGSIFSIDQLRSEIKLARQFGYLKDVAIYIHHTAVALQDQHKEIENESLKAIGSTRQGSAAAMIHKIMRQPGDNPTVGSSNKIKDKLVAMGAFVMCNSGYNQVIRGAERILAEGAQGFSLGINERFYPYCTSRDCTPARFMSDMAIPLPYLRTVIGTARTYPIRVGGTSGGCYPDQREVSWESIGLAPEYTTVTKRERRVFTFSKQQIDEAMYMMSPDEVFLNFCNYIKGSNEMSEIADHFGDKLAYMGYGPTVMNVTEVGDVNEEV